jgi:hypothetical protein
MVKYINIPFAWPFKMVPNTTTYDMHFDDAWWHEQRKHYERKVFYKQKWIKTKTTKLQVEANVIPGDLVVRDANYQVVKTFVWVAVFVATNYKIWELTFDMSDKLQGVYFLTGIEIPGENDPGWISEPVDIRNTWPRTLSFKYKNSFNVNDVAWTTGLEMLFTCEAGIGAFDPTRERTAYINQPLDVKTTYAVPGRLFKLLIGDAPGVPPYVLDILNRIFCCDHVMIGNMQWETPLGSKWEKTEIKGYPNIGASIDLVPANNAQSLQSSAGVEVGGGYIAAYEIETDWFGITSGPLTILDVEINQ